MITFKQWSRLAAATRHPIAVKIISRVDEVLRKSACLPVHVEVGDLLKPMFINAALLDDPTPNDVAQAVVDYLGAHGWEANAVNGANIDHHTIVIIGGGPT